MANAERRARLVHSQSRGRVGTGWMLVPAFLLVGAAGGALLGSVSDAGLADLFGLNRAASTQTVTQSFSMCSGAARVDCVVDGDTFWLDGVNIRIADINTPEVSQADCAAERQLGQKASNRLRDLLNAGPIELRMADRDEDVYGRKLRIVERDGRSLGAVLVAEGLAHEWRGYKEGWC